MKFEATEDAFNRAHKMLKEGKFEGVIDLVLNYDSGRIKKPFSSDLNHAWYVVADAYYRAMDYEQSLRAFKSSLRNNKEDYQAMIAIADCYSELGKPRQSLFYLEKAASVNNVNPKWKNVIRYNSGNAFFDMCDYVSAIREYKKVTKSNADAYSMARKNILLSEKLLKNPKEERKTKDQAQLKNSFRDV